MASSTTRALLALSARRTPLHRPTNIPRRLLHATPYSRSPASSPSSSAPAPSSPSPPPGKKAPDDHAPTWLTGVVQRSPAAMGVFLRVLRLMGYGSPQQIAARRTAALYETMCTGRAEEDAAFWTERCSLPPTFQSWFTVTNLHVWLLTTRLRALPAPAAQQHIQALIDHFFFDVEDRIRLVLRAAPNRGAALPVAVPSASPSSPNRSPSERARGLKPFYAPPGPLLDKDGKPIRRFAPERLVGLQMRVLKEQWAGLGLALDLGLVRGDTELAGAVWRNLLGGRGAAGIALPWAGMTPEEDAAHFRRAVNLVGGSAVEVRRVDLKGLDKEEKADDFSGVRDYRPSEADKYVGYPETMSALVRYIRREVARLESLSDEEIMGPQTDARGLPFPQVRLADVEKLRFGRVDDA